MMVCSMNIFSIVTCDKMGNIAKENYSYPRLKQAETKKTLLGFYGCRLTFHIYVTKCCFYGPVDFPLLSKSCLVKQ